MASRIVAFREEMIEVFLWLVDGIFEESTQVTGIIR